MAVSLLLAAALALAPTAATDVDDFEFASMDAFYALSRTDDGTSRLDVTEVFVAVFPEYDQNRGMRRIIPDTYLDAPLWPELRGISDDDGMPRPQEVDHEDGEYWMTSRTSDYVHGEQTYVFDYYLHNVTHHFDDLGVDEFYWDVNGLDWRQSFGHVSATLVMDAELAASLTGDMSCYWGSRGATAPCDISATTDADGSVIISAIADDLGPRQTMTIAIGFDAGTFEPFDSSFLASGWGWAQSSAAVGVLGALGWGVASRRKLANAKGRPTIIAEYDPPKGMDALQAALLLKRSAKAVPAEVVEQAVVGSIRIIEKPARGWGRPRLIAQLVDRELADDNGRMILDGLFPGGRPGAEYSFGSTSTRFSTAASAVVSHGQAALRENGYYRAIPTGTRGWPVVAAVAAGALVALFGFTALDSGVDAGLPLILILLAGVVFLVICILVNRHPLSVQGAEARDHLEGLRIFIEWAEADRIRMLQSPQGAERVPVDVDDPRQKLHLYEKLLPYAVVFGQERQWAQQLADLYGDTSPTWYSGSSAFSAASFSAGLSALSTSSSSSSSSGGSSGGGSAGGGGGGGGGGGV